MPSVAGTPGSPADSVARVLYNRQQAADFFGVSTRTLDEWSKTGKLNSIRLGRSVRYHIDDLMKVAEEGIAQG